jgi:signal transduction histidine kinase
MSQKQVQAANGGQRFDLKSAPWVIFALAAFIVVAGILTLINNDRNYLLLRQQETRSQAEILAASVAAAVDFGDHVAAQESVNAFRVNRQVRSVAVYDTSGALVAGYSRSGAAVPAKASELSSNTNDVRVRVPISAADHPVGTVTLQVEREALTRRVSRYVIWTALILLASLVVIVLGLAQHKLKRAHRELEMRAEALAAANVLLEEQISVRASAEEQLRQAQKMQALGQLTGGIAHDFNNLLTVIQGSADLLAREDLPEAKRVKYAQAIVQASANAAALTSQLLAFARRQPLKPERFRVNALIGSMRDLLDRTLGERIAVRTELCESNCEVEVDRNQLQSAILNIASNARDAMPQGGQLLITTRRHTDDDRPMVAIQVKDTGAGMDLETLDRVFEPFFTTKVAGKGTGLGLSQVYGFASQSGGKVEIASAVGKGTSLTIVLPCLPGTTTQMVDAKPSVPRTQKRARILVVDDNEQVATFAKTLVGELGHEVDLAQSGEEALVMVRSGAYDLVFSDIVMPGMGGLALSKLLAEEFPNLPVLLATGYSEEMVAKGTGDRTVILKPYRLATLAEAFDEALSRPPLQ